MRENKRHATLPIGRAARMAFEIDGVRGACCKAAEVLTSQEPMDMVELEECARLEESLAKAQRILKSTVRSILLSRLRRRSRAR